MKHVVEFIKQGFNIKTPHILYLIPIIVKINQIFIEEFGRSGDNDYAKTRNEELQKDFDTAEIKVIENVNHPAGVVSYVYGGG